MKNKIKFIVEWALVLLSFVTFIGTLVSPAIIAAMSGNAWFLFLWFVIGPIAIAELWLIMSLWGLYFEGFYRYKHKYKV